jgi:hypothetical protein
MEEDPIIGVCRSCGGGGGGGSGDCRSTTIVVGWARFLFRLDSEFTTSVVERRRVGGGGVVGPTTVRF